MKSFFTIALMILFAFLAHKFIPIWWLFALTTFLVSFAFGENIGKSLLTGFLSIFLLWLVLNTSTSFSNDFILVNKMASLFNLPVSFLLIVISALLGGIIGAFSSLSGYFLKTFSGSNNA